MNFIRYMNYRMTSYIVIPIVMFFLILIISLSANSHRVFEKSLSERKPCLTLQTPSQTNNHFNIGMEDREIELASGITQREVLMERISQHGEDKKDGVKSDSIEKIRVTGSRIRRISLERSLPVLTIDRKELEKTGYNSIADVLRDMTVNSFGSDRESSRKGAPGAADVSLRGLGADRTLVLIDGKRVQKDAFTNAVDLNLIPFAAVDKIEILKDSASAIYGSDALGGVVNIITRKNFHGSEVSVKQLLSEGLGGDQSEISLTSGYSHAKFDMVGIFYHRSNKAIYARDRDHSKWKFSTKGSPGTFRILKKDGTAYKEADGKTIALRSRFQVDPSCPPHRILDVRGGQVCRYNYADHITTRPELQQTSVMLNTNFDIKEGLSAFVRLGGMRRDVKWVFAPVPVDSSHGLGISGKQVRAYLPKGDSSLSESFAHLRDDDFVDIKYRLLELGNRITEVSTDQYNALAGVTMEMGETWEIEVSTGYRRSFRNDLGVSGFVRADDLKERLSKGFNPFEVPGRRGDLSDLNYQTWMSSLSDLAFAEVSANGEVIEISSGSIGMAVGTQVHKEIFQVDADESTKNDEVVGGAGSELSGDRSVISSYAELLIPLTNDMEWGLAGRHDSYSDFGRTFNPKTFLRWQVSPKIMLRSSVGRGFKAPNMDDLYKAKSVGRYTFIDQRLCRQSGACSPKRRKVIGWGNKDLQEERSVSASLGTVIQPTHAIFFGIDAWYLKLENQVGIDFGDVTIAEDRFGAEYIREFGINIVRDSITGEIKEMMTPTQNLAETETSGVDLSTEASTNIGIGQLILGIQHSHVFYTRVTGFPGLRKRNKLGESGFPPWRNIISLTYAPTNYQSGSLTARTVATHEKQSPEVGDLKQYTELDLQYAYSGSWDGVISIGVRNVLGTTPPIDDSNPMVPNLSTSLYDGNGRIGWIQYRQEF